MTVFALPTGGHQHERVHRDVILVDQPEVGQRGGQAGAAGQQQVLAGRPLELGDLLGEVVAGEAG